MKRIMSGQKFSKILRYLHVAPVGMPQQEAYDPSYKVAEFSNNLQNRFEYLSNAGYCQINPDTPLETTINYIVR